MREKQYHRDYTSKAMAAKRARDKGESDDHFYDEMRRVSEEYKEFKKGIKENE